MSRLVRVAIFFTLFFTTSIGNFGPIFAAALSEATSSASTPSIPKPLDLPFKGDYAVTRTFGEKLQGELAQNLKEVEGASGHNDLDFAMPEGTEILAVDEGEVIEAGEGDYGITVVLEHQWGRSVYGHLSQVKVESQSQSVKLVAKGQAIGLSGSSGISTGPHLHFGLKKCGSPSTSSGDSSDCQWVDPAPYLVLNDERLTTNVEQVLSEATNSAALSVSPSALGVSFEDVSENDNFFYKYKFNLADGTSAHFGHKTDPRPGFAIADEDYNYKLRFFLNQEATGSAAAVNSEPTTVNQSVAPIVDGNRIDFPIQIGGVLATLRYTISNKKVKEEIIIRKPVTRDQLPDGELRIPFEVQSVGLESKKTDSNYIFRSQDGSIYWRIAEPTIVDANGKSGEITGVLSSVIARSEATKQSDSETEIATSLDSLGTRNDNSLYTLTLTNDFLESASYPLTIDPTVILSGGFTETEGGDNLKTNTGAQIRESVMRQYPNAIEILDKRTENSKTFLVKTNPDGSKTYHWGGSVGEIHYKDNLKDESEVWKEIDTEVVKATDEQKQENGGHNFYNITNNFKSFFKKNSTDPNTVKYEDNGSFITFTNKDNELGNLRSVEGYAKDNQFIYSEAYDNIDIKYSIGTKMLLEEFVLKEQRDISSISQRVHFEDAYYQKQDDGSINFYSTKTNELVWSFPKPKMYELNEREDKDGLPSHFDNSGLYYEIAKDGDDYIVTKVLDQEGKDWFNSSERVYPLVIDSTLDLQVGVGADDGYWTNYPNFYPSDCCLTIGSIGGTPNHSWFRFTPVTIPQGATVDVANVTLKGGGLTGTTPIYTKLYGNDVDNATAPTTAAEAASKVLTTAAIDWDPSVFANGTWYDSLSITTIIQEIIDRAGWASGNALMLLHKNDGSTAGNRIVAYAYEYSGNVSGPKLHIEYTSNTAPNAPSSLGPTGLVDGSFTADNTPTLTFTLSDPDASDTVKFQIQIDDSSDFSSVVVDYTSALAAQGSASFTVGQAAGSGSYTTGSEGQTLSDGSYYWQVKAIDNSSASSSYTQANSGAIAFKVDTIAPSVPTNLTSTLIADKQARLTWDAVSGANSYKVYKSTTNNSSGFTNVGTPTNANYDADMNCDRHWFYVTSLDSVSNESAASSTTEILPNCPSTSTSSTSSGSSTSTSTTTTTASPSPSLSSQLETGNWKLETEEEANGPIIPKLSLPKELAKIPQLVGKAGVLKKFFAYVLREIRDFGQYLAARFGDGLAYVSDKLAQVAIYFGGNIKGSKTDLAQVPKLQITDVGIIKLSSTAVIINWKTNKEATSKINFGLDTSYGNEAQDTDLVKEHSVTLENLEPDETYYFEVMSQVGNDYVFDAYYTFTTSER